MRSCLDVCVKQRKQSLRESSHLWMLHCKLHDGNVVYLQCHSEWVRVRIVLKRTVVGEAGD